MISIIISSANTEYLQQVKQNITDTIGLPFEIIAIDNSKGQQGICAIYNQGIQKAKYDMLCFMHEDILIKTESWGVSVINFFKQNPEYGLLGVGGSEYKSLAPSGWNPTGVDTAYINIIQRFKYQEKEPFHYHNNTGNKKFAEVACLDGIWFCAPKSVAQKVRFDEETFKGFHVYDIDFSLAVSRSYKMAVTFDVLIDHFSEGEYEADWLNETIKLHKKWAALLPVNLRPLSRKEMLKAEKETFKLFIDLLIKFNFPGSAALEMLYYKNRYFKLSPKLFFKLNYTILKKFARR